MRRLLLPFLSVALIAACDVSTAAAQSGSRVKFAAEVPLIDCDGMPCIEAKIGSGPALKMGIDTGNVDSVLDAPFAEAAGLKSTTPLPAGAPPGMFRTAVPIVSIG